MRVCYVFADGSENFLSYPSIVLHAQKRTRVRCLRIAIYIPLTLLSLCAFVCRFWVDTCTQSDTCANARRTAGGPNGASLGVSSRLRRHRSPTHGARKSLGVPHLQRSRHPVGALRTWRSCLQ